MCLPSNCMNANRNLYVQLSYIFRGALANKTIHFTVPDMAFLISLENK